MSIICLSHDVVQLIYSVDVVCIILYTRFGIIWSCFQISGSNILIGDMGFNGLFSDPHYRYGGPTDESFLIRLVDISFNRMFSDPHCQFLWPTDRSHCNQIKHGLEITQVMGIDPILTTPHVSNVSYIKK